MLSSTSNPSRTSARRASPTGPTIEMVVPTGLKPNPKNPRLHSEKQITQIAASIRAFGFNVPVLIDANQQVIAGHGRVLAAQQLGLDKIPAILLAHLSSEQARAFMIADNRLTENATWDDDLLAEHFEFLSSVDLDFSITDTGYELPEIDWTIESRSRRSRPLKEQAATGGGPAVTRAGDLWLLGNHRLLCGDARSADAYAVLMGDRKAAMVFTDPPYNVRIDGHVGGKGDVHHREFAMASGEMTSTDFTAFLQQVCRQMAGASEEGSIHFICMDWRHIQELLAATNQVYTELKNLCVWAKDNGGMGSLYRSQHELIFVFKQGDAPHINNVELGRFGRNRSNVWNYPGVNSFGRNTSEGNLLAVHPTVKPVEMVADALLDCSRRGALILDPFCGSGTTLVASERTGRTCFALEIDPLYVDAAIRRWQRLTGHVAVSGTTGEPFDNPAQLLEPERIDHA